MAWIFFDALPCRKKKIMATCGSMLLKSRASLTCFRACFLPGRAKDLSAPPYNAMYTSGVLLHFLDIFWLVPSLYFKKKFVLQCCRYGCIYTLYPRFYTLIYLVVWVGRGWRGGTRLRTEGRNCIVTMSISTSGLLSRHYSGRETEPDPSPTAWCTDEAINPHYDCTACCKATVSLGENQFTYLHIHTHFLNPYRTNVENRVSS